MRKYIYLWVALFCAAVVYSQEALLMFTIDYKSENNCNAVLLHANEAVTVDWGNGQQETLSPERNRIVLHHEFSLDKEYIVKIFGAPEAVTGFELFDDTDITSVVTGAGCQIELFHYCYGLSNLDIQSAEKVKELYLGNGNITSLDLATNPNLEYLDLYNNPIAKDKKALLAMIESLPDRSGKEPGTLVINMGDFPRYKALCERKNWMLK